jgi:hypothetical protein
LYGADPVSQRNRDAVESNARLTAGAGGVLLLLLAAEGLTLLSVRSLLTAHVVIGMVLIPPVLLKMGSTGWRIVRNYTGSSAYRLKGPPPLLLRVLGPGVVLLTATLLASGVGLVFGPHNWRHQLLVLLKASFLLWFGVMTIHVLGHVLDTARLAPLDWARRTRGEVSGATARQWALAASLAGGGILGIASISAAHSYLPFAHR